VVQTKYHGHVAVSSIFLTQASIFRENVHILYLLPYPGPACERFQDPCFSRITTAISQLLAARWLQKCVSLARYEFVIVLQLRDGAPHSVHVQLKKICACINKDVFLVTQFQSTAKQEQETCYISAQYHPQLRTCYANNGQLKTSRVFKVVPRIQVSFIYNDK
jgi:hypothetical protein